MAIPTIKVNLVLQKPFLQTYHFFISWFALILGGLMLTGALALAFTSYVEMARSKKQLSNLTSISIASSAADVDVVNANVLQGLDVIKELPTWQLAERVYAERSVTWSRLTEELGRSLVHGVRINSIVRHSFSGRGIKIEVVGEARSRYAEVAFMESLKKNGFFKQVTFEKESERPGEGVLFTCVINIF